MAAPEDDAPPPTRWEWLTRRVRRGAHALVRHARWRLEPGSFGRLDLPYATRPAAYELARVTSPLGRVGGHPILEAGKRHNVALACAILDGLELGPERPFSFWRALGPATLERGFRPGVEIWSGCALPSVGGGLCLLSNAIFEAALRAGMRVLERHAHTRALGEASVIDATVAYPHVDLRVRPRGRAVLRARVAHDVLVVAFEGDEAATPITLQMDVEGTHDPLRRRVRLVRRFEREGREELVLDEPKALLRDATRTCLDCGAACEAGEGASRAAGLVRLTRRAEVSSRRGA